jgi:hypothetical protein
MRIQKTHAAALALIGAFAVSAATPSFAAGSLDGGHMATGSAMTAHASYNPPEQVYGAASDAYKPGYTGYGRQAYNPEQPTDPDPRIGGAFKMSTDR